MVSGIDVVLFRPDEELKRLAQRAVEDGIADAVKAASDEPALRAALSGSDEGEAWLSDWDETKSPWFNYSNGNGFYHHHRSWIDDPAIPIAGVRSYIERLEAGEEIARPLDAVTAERDRVASEYRDLLPDDEARQAFDQALGLSRTVFPYVESHNFYVEHWYHTVFWNKVREFGDLLARNGFLEDAEDVFYLQRSEVSDALIDLRLAWAAGSAGARSRLLASDRRRAQADHGGDARLVAAAGPRGGARGDHRAADDHALGHHDRARAGMGGGRERRRRLAERLRRLARGRRGHRSRDPRRPRHR